MLSQQSGRRPRAVCHLLARVLMRPLTLLALGLFSCGFANATTARVGPTVKEVVEFTRIVQPANEDADALRAQTSPDGERAFIVTRKADVQTDKNRFQILLLDVRPDRLATRQTARPERLLTIEAGQDNNDADPFLQDARWVGNRTIVFRGRMLDAPFQVYKLNVVTRRLTQLTFEARGIVSFAVSNDLRRVVYVAQLPNPAMPPGARSVVVGNNSFWSIKHGQSDLRSQQRRYQYFAVESGSRKAGRKLGEPFPEASGSVPRVSMSPNGRWALLPRYEPDRQLAWALQYPLVADAMARFGPGLTSDPLSYFSRPQAYVARRLVAYRLSDGKEQVVVDAPDDSVPGGGQLRSDRLWQGAGNSVVMAGTHLPVQMGGEASRGSGSHIVEYWPDSGRWTVIAALKGRLEAAHAVDDQRDGFVAIDAGQRRNFARRPDGSWLELDGVGEPADTKAARGFPRGGWSLRVDASLNRPPDVVAAGPSGATVRLTTLNPQFSSATWGKMRPYAWKDAKGRPWDGGLMVPSDFDPTTPHPLVIQTYGFSPARFYLDGANLSDGYTSGFAGRAFLRENILVLALPWRASSGAPSDEPGAIAAFVDGVRGAIESLVREGLVDRERIGIMGWSATGERVLNMVTFSDVPIRAATILDGDANTVFSMAVTYAANDGALARKERTNGGGPFGNTLDRWVRNDPALHTDCVKAALRIETYGPWVLNNWDIHALLRRQYKPAEMIVIPDGTHALSRPSERMISLQGNVDWHRFWLKGEERSEVFLLAETDASLKQQYTRWRQMADLKRADDAKPRCVPKSSGG